MPKGDVAPFFHSTQRGCMMSRIIPCSTCEEDRQMDLVQRMESLTVNGKEIRFGAEFYRCRVCGSEIEDHGQLDRNLEAAREVYDQLYATPTPSDLVALREKYGASQKAFGMLLGFGEATMNTYEKGNPPDPSNRLLLLLTQKPMVFKEIYDLNKNRIGLLQRKRIERSRGYREACDWILVPCSQVRAGFSVLSATQWQPTVKSKEEIPPLPNKGAA